jgi:hypothetical protein
MSADHNWYCQETKAAAADARPNLHSKLGASGSFSQKLTRTCVQLMVARIGHNWDATAMQNPIALIVQTMVVEHNFAGIQDYDKYDALLENRRAAEKTLRRGFQESNNRGAKAFRDRARELIMPFFFKGDCTKEQAEKYVHAMLSAFEFTGSTVLYHLHPAGHPVLLVCMATPPPTECGELTAAPPSRPRPRHSATDGAPCRGSSTMTIASPSRSRPRHATQHYPVCVISARFGRGPHHAQEFMMATST